MKKNSGLIFSAITFIVYLMMAQCHWPSSPKPIRSADPISWYENKIQINYQNGSVDTIIIDVYERPDNIKVENGNLSYWKSTKGSGMFAGYVVNQASYVRSFKILKSEIKTKAQ